jgi:uncharacterized membrane protein (UPF0127 family)
MAWLVRDNEVLATLEIATSRSARRRGLLGRDGIDGALLIPATRSVHSFGMRFDIDVAFLDTDHRVLKIVALRRGRVTAPVWAAQAVVEAEAGSFREWGLQCGDELEIR